MFNGRATREIPVKYSMQNHYIGSSSNTQRIPKESFDLPRASRKPWLYRCDVSKLRTHSTTVAMQIINETSPPRVEEPVAQAGRRSLSTAYSFTAENACAANSRSSRLWAADTCVLIRAFPCGTTGYEKPMT